MVTILVQHYFIGFKIPETVAEHLDQARSTWDLQETHKVIPHVSDLHITLLYLGGVEEELFQKLSGRLDDLEVTCPSFDLTIKGVSTFGSSRKPRVIHASVEEQSKLKQLHGHVKNIAESLNFKVDQKLFVPHITLAKKWIGNGELDIGNMQVEQMNFTIEHFSIYSIHPQKIPSYQAVKTVNLKGKS